LCILWIDCSRQRSELEIIVHLYDTIQVQGIDSAVPQPGGILRDQPYAHLQHLVPNIDIGTAFIDVPSLCHQVDQTAPGDPKINNFADSIVKGRGSLVVPDMESDEVEG